MSGISGISGINTSLYSSYSHLSSGKKLNSAADGAAEIAIVNKLESQTRGDDAGVNNMKSGQDLLNVTDGALGQIGDYLQSIHELAVQASNSAVYTDSDISSIQDQIDQYKQGISDIASQTQFNTKNLLDGSNGSMEIATNANGDSISVNGSNATLKALGIEDFDVTGNFSIDDINKALEKVNSSRSEAGAKYNALDHAISYTSYSSQNMTAASSRLEDLDYGPAISEQKKKEVLMNYSMMMQKKQLEQQRQRFNIMFQ